jgi:hypothetical protein
MNLQIGNRKSHAGFSGNFFCVVVQSFKLFEFVQSNVWQFNLLSVINVIKGQPYDFYNLRFFQQHCIECLSTNDGVVVE